MSNKVLVRPSEFFPSLVNEYFGPWEDRMGKGGLWGRPFTMPRVNVVENKDEYRISVGAPGLTKSDFNIDVDGNLLTVSSEKEDNIEEKDARYTRNEYNYSSFSRSFTIPDEVLKDKIEAIYEDGILKLVLPKKEEAKKLELSKHIAVK